MIKITLVFIFFIFCKISSGQCPDEGNAKSIRIQQLNILKNRTYVRFDSINGVGLDDILEEGPDIDRWSNDQQWGLYGYLYKWKYGGPETCNCKSTDRNLWDIHLYVALSPDEVDESNMMIWEITHKSYEGDPTLKDPAYLNSLLGSKIYGEGYSFGDVEHLSNARNTGHGKVKWRKTIWEIHPLTVLLKGE